MENYKSLYENARVALFRTRINDGKILECNDYMARMMGYKNYQECQKKAYTTNYADPKGRSKFIKLLRENGQVENFELKSKRLNGDLIWLKVSAKIYPEKGYLEGGLWDITVSKLLSGKETEILRLILKGKSSKEIANHLKRSVRTIEDHRAHIMRKLKVNNIVELTKKAAEFDIGL